MNTEPHAVRWAKRVSPMLGVVWTRWHWTEDAQRAICGDAINFMNDRAPYMPDTDDREEKVTCKNCKRALARKATRNEK